MRTACAEDPLDEDSADDAKLVTTRRGLMRLALVAAEAGARFQREGVGLDPMTWLLAPRRLFGGSTAIEACLARENFMRALMVHGLSLELDAEPSQTGALLCGTAGDIGGGFWDGHFPGGEPDGQIFRRQRLYSATIVIARGGELVHLFHASVAPTASVVRERIRARFGAAAAAQADIRVGVDLDCPATSEMLPPVFRTFVERGRRIRWSTMVGLDVTVEHRIPS
ncbi:MAG: hypothetical protein A4S12_00655 [Proteobacteria bacterium SG_bin5]|nr:MAG: hypothetical protein A4S12_00655 [Proteobacteria bacterium SG_bin5]